MSTSIQITFNEAMTASTITTGTSTTCSGSIQLSSSSTFATCVAMSSSVSASSDLKTFTATPAANLSSLTQYYIKVTTAAKDASSNALASDYTDSIGFQTADGTAPTVSSVSPNAAIAPSTTSVSVVFSEAMDTTTVTADNSGNCSSGTIRLRKSSDSTCLAFSSNTPTASNSNKTFTATLSTQMSETTGYYVEVSTSVKDTSGNALASTYTGTTFTTNTVYSSLTAPGTGFARGSCVYLSGVGTWGSIFCYPGIQYHATSESAYQTIQYYDLLNANWNTLATSLAAGSWWRAAAPNGTTIGYAYGGTADNTAGSTNCQYSSSTTTLSNCATTTNAASSYAGTFTYPGTGSTIYYIGGAVTNTTPVTTIKLYDTAAGWSTSGTVLSTARKWHTADYASSVIYLIGGMGTSAALDSVEGYTPGAASMTTINATLSTARYRHCSGVYNNNVYVFGGVNSSGTVISSVEMYNTSTSSFSTKTSMPAARADMGCVGDGTYIYLIGGMTDITDTKTVGSTFYRYDPSKD
ncbi:MAG: Ig-like domain-containing protein [bacterium]|nr:Ig-like domain-containing protein [bacterium]